MTGLPGFLLRWRKPLIVLGHAGLVVVSYALAYILRFDLSIPDDDLERFWKTLPLLLAIRLAVYAKYELYEGMWRFVSVRDFSQIITATGLSSLIFVAAGVILAFLGQGFPRSIYLLDFVLCITLVGGSRIALRSALEVMSASERKGRRPDEVMKKAIIVGAGDAAAHLIRVIEGTGRLPYELLGFVDDDPRKQQQRILGVKVIGTIDQLPTLCQNLEAEEILIAIPSLEGENRRRIIERCRESGIPLKTVPSVGELITGRASVGQLQEVNPEDLLGREPVAVDTDILNKELGGKTVMVTGAGGSIGSELIRQIATFGPKRLLLFERAESNLYFVDLDLKQRHPELDVVPIVGDILDEAKLEQVMKDYSPEVVYHAAAYKHVPLMEDHPLDAIANNVLGTAAVARVAREHGVAKFVLISTDKAVKPVSVMGRTKRVAESVLLGLGGGPTTFVAVRFGNVLGSDGSVLPLFRWQMAMGGPVTITASDATRYFMLISEAAQLVLQAGAMGEDGDMFFLDMGEPVKIIDLAENLIRLSGLAPHRDVPVDVIGLRPGERLQEELLVETETLEKSSHEKIFLATKMGFDPESFTKDLEELKWKVWERDVAGAGEALERMADRY
jgi:FlaA1/EpsC-like NDP-sugar epimerase